MTRARSWIAVLTVGVGVAAVTLAVRSFAVATASRDDRPSDKGAAAGDPVILPVTALGRIEPRDGVVRVAGPSEASIVLAELRVDDGDEVRAGEVIAVLDTLEQRSAEVERLEAELAYARAEHERHDSLFRDGAESTSNRERMELRVRQLEARLRSARVARERALVRSPIDGRVLAVHRRAGERVGPEGIVELGGTHAMVVIAEVYDADVARVRVGQRAEVRSPALGTPLAGTVERIGLKVGRLEGASLDPAAKVDARVVEVEIRLDEPERGAGLTNLQVDVSIGTSDLARAEHP